VRFSCVWCVCVCAYVIIDMRETSEPGLCRLSYSNCSASVVDNQGGALVDNQGGAVDNQGSRRCTPTRQEVHLSTKLIIKEKQLITKMHTTSGSDAHQHHAHKMHTNTTHTHEHKTHTCCSSCEGTSDRARDGITNDGIILS